MFRLLLTITLLTGKYLRLAESRTIQGIISSGFIELSFYYADLYKKKGKLLIECFNKFRSIRLCCESIIVEYKKTGAFDDCKRCGKDFSEYAERFSMSEKDKKTLSGILLIIYNLNKYSNDK